jgi:CO/xanthine dehydrogenase FAD-binding subunit
MKPAKFTYYAPNSLAEACEMLAEHGEEGKVIAGGQSLVPVMNFRLAQPASLIDINNIDELAGIRNEGDLLIIGALARHAEIERSELIAQSCPILVEAAGHIGHLPIRERGTIGGSLANADPAAEWSLMACLLDAEIAILSQRGRREVSAGEFIQSVYTTDLEADELVTEISFPQLDRNEGWSLKQVRRRVGDFAIVAVAVTLHLSADETIQHMRLCVAGMEVTPVRLVDVENESIGKSPDDDWISATASAAAAAGSPESDVRASAEYRRELCGVLTERALSEALDRTREGKA